jgi:lactate permease
MVGRQTPILALFVPFVLAGVVGGWRGMLGVWPAALTAGGVFALFQYVTSNFLSIPLTDIVAALASAAAVVVLLRFWQPQHSLRAEHFAPTANGATARGHRARDDTRRGTSGGRATGDSPAGALAAGGSATEAAGPTDRSRAAKATAGVGADPHVVDTQPDVVRAYTPYVVIIALFGIGQIPGVRSALARTVTSFAWPGLHVLTPQGKPVASATFAFGYLTAAGTTLLLAGLITMVVLRLNPVRAVRAYADTLIQLAFAILTVMAVLALAYVMNAAGETTTLGKWMAGAGGLFALLSPILGWFGVAVTGSDTSSNSLFGALQVAAANDAHLNPILMAAGNSNDDPLSGLRRAAGRHL